MYFLCCCKILRNPGSMPAHSRMHHIHYYNSPALWQFSQQVSIARRVCTVCIVITPASYPPNSCPSPSGPLPPAGGGGQLLPRGAGVAELFQEQGSSLTPRHLPLQLRGAGAAVPGQQAGGGGGPGGLPERGRGRGPEEVHRQGGDADGDGV